MTFLRRAVFVFLVLVPLAALGQSADQAIVSVLDAPDPVVPGNTLTYTITFQNNGPDPAVNGGVNLLFDGNFTPTSVVPPAGFNCTALAQIMTCNTPSFTPGGPVVITAQGTVAAHLNAFPDGTLTSSFTTSGVTADPNAGNNSSGNIMTAYNSPQVDLSIAVTDNPDPVGPNADITYTVDLTNSGPDNANSVNFNVFNNGSLRYQSITIPTGWSCPSQPSVGGNPTFTCSRATWAPGTSQFIVVVRADPAVLGINDGSVQTAFSVFANASDETDDGSDNSETETTQYVTPDADVAITVSDSPDPVFPDGDITYTVTVSNNGPDTAPNITLNSFGSNNLRFQSATIPAGWNCTLPSPGTQTPGYSCTLAAGLVSGASSVLTFVMQADDALLGINDQTILFGFQANSTIADPVPGNNSETESTAYTTPDADVAITVSDSPDPVFPDGNITYTVTVSNNGPDTAPNITLNSFGGNNLRFQSASVPAGWNCTLPSAGTQTTSYSCTLAAGLVSGASSVLTFVMQADDAFLGINDTTILFGYQANSTIADPVANNNSETESTQYSTPDANVGITASDAPDPVTNGQNVTFTVNASNAGPDPGPNAAVTFAPHPSLVFQSVTAPAGWACTDPGVGNAGVTQCTRASMASGETPQFTLVTKLITSGSGGTLSSNFSIVTAAQDPENTNNSVTVFTNWIGQTSDLALDKVTTSTAAAQGSTITYTIYTANNGPTTATDVTVTDVLPAQLLFQSLAAPAGWSCTTPAVGANGTVTCTLASMPAPSAAQFTLVTTVAPLATGTITNAATISGPYVTDPVPNGSGSSSPVAVAGNSDLGITKTTGATGATRGGALSYTITVTNNGPEAAASVVMTDTLPASLLFQSIATPGPQWNCTTPAVGTTGTITCSTATLANGATAVFTLNTTVANNATGSITNTASVAHSGPDANGGNSGASSPATPVAAASADLTATKTTATTSVTPGQAFSYTINVTNNGPDLAANPSMTDNLPASLLFQSISAPAGWTCATPAVGATGTITCSAASLAANATASFTLTVTVANGASGTITNQVVVAGADSDPTPGNNTVTSAPVPVTPPAADLSITKTTASGSVAVGTTFSYTITVLNNGPATATGVTVNDTLPAGLEFVSATPSQGTCNAASPLVCNLGTIVPANNATVTLVVRALTPGTVVNTATVTSADDTAPGNNTDDAPGVTITAAPGEAEIPTLSEWALIALMGILAVVAAMRMRN